MWLFYDWFHEIHRSKHFGSLFKSIAIPIGSSGDRVNVALQQ